jgi:hypothetical protein
LFVLKYIVTEEAFIPAVFVIVYVIFIGIEIILRLSKSAGVWSMNETEVGYAKLRLTARIEIRKNTL